MSDADETSGPILVLLGSPSFTAGKARSVFTTERPFQLLAYLACRRDWVRRDELAEILYPDRGTTQARSNLRKVLLLAERVPGVRVERQGDQLRWLADSDLSRFESAIDSHHLSDAIALGAAPLLQGFDGAFSGGGASWLAGERQRVATLWHSACMRRLGELIDRPAEAARLAQSLLERDPLDEAALRAQARALLGLGEAEAAGAAIAAYARRLADQLGVEPSTAVRELAGSAGRVSAQLSTASAIPAADDSFVGRRAELQRLVDLLRQPECRLLTLTGPGGVGKTSVAARLGVRLASDLVGSVVVVPLADLTEVAQVPGRIAARIGMMMSGGDEPWAQIAKAIDDQSLALIIDNAEHLGIGDKLERLIQSTARLRLVVTSRARLGVGTETVFALDGLPLPDDDERDVAVLRCCDAVALFEMRALAASRGFDLAAHAGDVVRLVHAVEGLPLAIELAAAWTRLLPVAEIADEIGRSAELLEGRAGTSRGLRSSFAQSWRLLDDAERACLARLAWLPADFDRAMALQVAGASLEILASLVDKSLIRADGSGRFSMHPLLRSCATEKEVPGDEVRTRHAAFIAQWLGEWDGAPATMQVLIARIALELSHVRAAWSWALEHADAAVIERMARPLSNFYEQQGLWPEGIAALSAAVRTLPRSDPLHERALAVVYRGLSALQYHTDALDEGDASAGEMMDLARSLGDPRLMRYALNMRGICLRRRGSCEQARACFLEGLERAEREGSRPHTALFTANLAKTDASLGRYDDALAGHERALAMYREQVNEFSAAIELQNIGQLLRARGQPAQAIERLNEALVACAEHGFKSIQCAVSLDIGLCFDDLGDGPHSSKWLLAALQEARQCGEPQTEILALLASVRLDCNGGHSQQARAKAWEALRLADRTKAGSLHAQCVAAFGEILVHEQQHGDGLALMRWAARRPEIDRLGRDELERRMQRLVDGLTGVSVASRDLTHLPIASVLALVVAATPRSA